MSSASSFGVNDLFCSFNSVLLPGFVSASCLVIIVHLLLVLVLIRLLVSEICLVCEFSAQSLTARLACHIAETSHLALDSSGFRGSIEGDSSSFCSPAGLFFI